MNEHLSDLLNLMSDVIADEATKNISLRGGRDVPTTLISDFAKYDVAAVSKKCHTPFLWHVHWAGTYLHFLDLDSHSEDFNGHPEVWRKGFEQNYDWACDELTHNWEMDGQKDRFFFYDGDLEHVAQWWGARRNSFREVSREEALVIRTAYGNACIAEMERTKVEVSITA